MAQSLLIQVREKRAKATRAELRRWQATRLPKPEAERAHLASELSQLITEESAQLASDRDMIRNLVRHAADRSPRDVDQVNELLQRYLGIVIDLCGVLRSMARKFTAAGHPVEGAEALDSLIAERERWREDLPDQLALASGPVRAVLQERIAKTLKSPPEAMDWRSLFE